MQHNYRDRARFYRTTYVTVRYFVFLYFCKHIFILKPFGLIDMVMLSGTFSTRFNFNPEG